MCTKYLRVVALTVGAVFVASGVWAQETPPPDESQVKEEKAKSVREQIEAQNEQMRRRLQDSREFSVSVRGGNGDPDRDFIESMQQYRIEIRERIKRIDGSYSAYSQSRQDPVAQNGDPFRPWVRDVYTVLSRARRRAIAELRHTRDYAKAELIMRTALTEVGGSLRGADPRLGGPMTWNLVNQANLILHRLDEVFRRNPMCAIADEPFRCGNIRDEEAAQTFVVAFCDQWIDFILSEGYNMDWEYSYPRHVYHYHGRWDMYRESHASLQKRYMQFAFAQMRMANYGFTLAFPANNRERRLPGIYDFEQRLSELRKKFSRDELHYGRQSWASVYGQEPHIVFTLGANPKGYLTVAMMVAGFAKNEMYRNWFGSLYAWPAWELESLEADLYEYLLGSRRMTTFFSDDEAKSATWHLFNDIILNYELAREHECQDWRPYRAPRRHYGEQLGPYNWDGCPDEQRRTHRR